MLDKIISFITNLLRKKKQLRLGFYGSPNAGKTTLANRIAKDFVGKEIGKASEIPHETRSVSKLENVLLTNNGKSLELSLLDMPGISTKIDYREFLRYGLNKKDAQLRAREATKGVVEAIKYLDNIDAAMLVIDSSEEPYTEVNLTLLGNLEAKKIPIIIVANKADLPNANPKKVKEAFQDYNYPIVTISALTGKNIDQLYKVIEEKLG